MLYLVLYMGFCALVAWFGSKRRLGFWGYFFCSLIFTPLIGLLLVVGSDKATVPSQISKFVSELDELRSYVAKFQSAGLTPAETRDLVDRLTALQRSVMYKTI